jgi:hypothetical protein
MPFVIGDSTAPVQLQPMMNEKGEPLVNVVYKPITVAAAEKKKQHMLKMNAARREGAAKTKNAKAIIKSLEDEVERLKGGSVPVQAIMPTVQTPVLNDDAAFERRIKQYMAQQQAEQTKASEIKRKTEENIAQQVEERLSRLMSEQNTVKSSHLIEKKPKPVKIIADDPTEIVPVVPTPTNARSIGTQAKGRSIG